MGETISEECYAFQEHNKSWKAMSSSLKRRITLRPEASQAGHRFFAVGSEW